MKKLLLLLTCLLTVANAATAVAKAPSPIRLDRSFGTKGKATIAFPSQSGSGLGIKYEVPFQFTAGHIEMASAPGHKLVVAGSTKIVRLAANGRVDRSFGAGGAVAIPSLPGVSFVLAGIAVDSLGRVVIAGSVRPLPSSTTLDPLRSSVAVMRFDADGSLDSGFGSGGVLISDLGFEPPTVPTGKYPGAAVGVRSIAVDLQNRIVLTGGAVVKASTCGPKGALASAYVARLAESGALDPSFNGSGVRQISDLASAIWVSITPTGSLFTVDTGNDRCGDEGGGAGVVLSSFNADGSFDPSFGFSGFRSIRYPQAPTATVAPSGKIVLLGAKRKQGQVIARLLPNGAPDPSFSRVGKTTLVLPKSMSFAAVDVDQSGRVYLAGRVSRRISKKPNNTLRRSTFVLGRLNRDGTIDRSPGRRGLLTTGFGGPASSFATQVIVERRGRIVVGGGISTPGLSTGGGFAIARYLSDR
ncbi:MAG TPA: hypothetical protein VN732_10860 [Solirubrobacterales bacterium]|nr:hypothetical protein [Solirubrobacterales bacterium]